VKPTPQVVLIGAGRWGINIARNLQELGALGGIADIDAARARSVASAVGGARVFESIDEALADESPAVAIATPAQTHYTVANAALERDKDVFVEKPLTLEPADAVALAERSNAAGRVLMVGHMLLYQPAVRAIKDFVQGGAFGDLNFVHQSRRNLGTIRKHENVLYSFGVHDIAVIDFIAQRRLVSVVAVGQSCITPGIEDEVTAHLAFEGGLETHLYLSWLWPVKERKMLLRFQRGYVEYDEATNIVVARELLEASAGSFALGEERRLFEGSSDPLKLELRHFLDCIETRATPLSGPSHAVEVVSILDRIQTALQAGKR
jgi:predicted dehydrogenase